MKEMKIEVKTELARIRGWVWYQHCLKLANAKTYTELHNKTAVNDKTVFDQDNRWVGIYGGGMFPSKPSLIKLDQALIELKLVPKGQLGAAYVYQLGPYGLPLWAVLNNDVAVCAQLLDRLLTEHLQGHVGMILSRKVVSVMTLAEKCMCLIEISMPSSFYRKPNKAVDKDADWLRQDNVKFPAWVNLGKMPFNRDDTFYTLAEIVKSDTNIIGESYLEGKRKIKRNKFPMLNASLEQKYLITSPLHILGFLAASELVLNDTEMMKSKSLKKIPSYFKDGISEALEVFGKEVKKYVAENM